MITNNLKILTVLNIVPFILEKDLFLFLQFTLLQSDQSDDVSAMALLLLHNKIIVFINKIKSLI